uniref:TSA: Wollemia nobilis Ref_Wollemi_Transcript_14026_2004 transcribed RNA sequence n=1 Tax=Wollemia nobilis TaxID=56998 RepID=A0A0C9S4C9_9CONI
MLKSLGLMRGGASVLHSGRTREAAFSLTISLSPVRQKLPRKRTWKCTVVRCSNSTQGIQQSTTPQADTVGLSDLSFDRLQPADQDCKTRYKRAFGKFVAREAILDEEFWTAAWLRAESHWEDQPHDRYVDSHKRKFAEQEFNALKRRCVGRDGHSLKCFCIVAVKKEDKNKRRTVLNSVVGTLDLSIRQLLQGETFPGEQMRASMYMSSSKPGCSHRYGYVANVCVTKFARRQGIGSNMLQLAIEIANSCGLKDVFVHVNMNNKIAQQLYRKIGFEMVEAATSNLLIEQKQLLLLGHQI